ncbi:MAG: Holliday junction branch migration protein RuvA [Sphingobacteriales bacterium JAD_PAG50586_3]|nr:MAG: Holliday junction branch migration protein RuvA [Sphingobacteriales bacterium JAD_PAG50586_3]
MIAHLNGTVTEKTPTHVVIDCAGVGYLANISLTTYSKIGNVNQQARLLIHAVYREDAQLLFGFAEPAEREMFRYLISVSGVGGNTALLMLSALTVADIEAAIATANLSLLKGVKGIGEKTAQRIIVDLRGKVTKGSAGMPGNLLTGVHRERDEAITALISLGFNKASVEKAVDGIIRKQGDALTVEQIIKEGLKVL